jgi:hypothetical protein
VPYRRCKERKESANFQDQDKKLAIPLTIMFSMAGMASASLGTGERRMRSREGKRIGAGAGGGSGRRLVVLKRGGGEVRGRRGRHVCKGGAVSSSCRSGQSPWPCCLLFWLALLHMFFYLHLTLFFHTLQ